MKVVVFSDSHGNAGVMEKIILRERPELIIHLGDGAGDCREIQNRYPDIPVLQVKGNCDLGWELPVREVADLDGVRLFMTHGHEYNVRLTLEKLLLAGSLSGANAVLYGHTHVPKYGIVGDMTVINPGSVGQDGFYGVMELSDGAIRYESRLWE